MSLGLTIALVALTSTALALLLLPLLVRRRRQEAREGYNLAVYRDQLAEIDRDRGRGLLDGEQAEAARAEIGRRILALGPAQDAPPPAAGPLAAAVLGILLLPLAALLLYARLGSPGLPDRPGATPGTPAGEAASPAVPGEAAHRDLAQAVEQLRTHLRQHPEDLTGQLLLARSELSLGNYADAAQAYRLAADLSGHRPDISADWGEAQVLAAGGTVTPAARAAFTAALKDPQSAPRARYYLALAQFQQGDAKGALQAWTALEADSPTGADWLPLLRQRIAEAAAALGGDAASLSAPGAAGRADAKPAGSPPGTPEPSAVAAAARATAGDPPEARAAMVEAMVERLAARLQQQPDDAEGWARLGRSYMVLHRPDKAREAYARALKLRPGDAPLQQALAEAKAEAAAAHTPDPAPAR